MTQGPHGSDFWARAVGDALPINPATQYGPAVRVPLLSAMLEELAVICVFCVHHKDPPRRRRRPEWMPWHSHTCSLIIHDHGQIPNDRDIRTSEAQEQSRHGDCTGNTGHQRRPGC